MTELELFRTRYPQYNDMSDQQVADKLYQHYSDMPRDKFDDKLGLPAKGLKGIGQDIKSGISNVPAALASALSNLPGQTYESGKQVLTHPVRAAENVGAGALEGLKGAVNIPSNIANYLGSKDIGRGSIEDFIKQLNIGDTGLQKQILGAPQPGDELLQGIGSFAPFGIAGGVGKGIAGLARRAAANAAYAAGQNQNPLTASLMGATGEGATAALQKALRRSNFLPSSPLSNEALKAAAENAAGTESGLGNVIDNPGLKTKLENTLAEIPFSGAKPTMQRTGQAIADKGSAILEDLKGDYEGTNLGYSLQKALKDAEKEVTAQKNANFKKVNEAAEKAGVTTDRSNFLNMANNTLEQIKSDPHLEMLADPSSKKLLKKITSEGEEEEEIPENQKSNDFSLKNTDFLRSKLGEKSHDAYMADNTELGKLYGGLKEAADTDIDKAIDNSGNEELKNLRDQAMEHYRAEYAPFKDPDILKFTRRGGDPDTLVNTFIKTSRINDRTTLLSKLSAKLSPKDRQLLSYAYFSRAFKDGQFNPSTFAELYKALGDNQKEALLPSETRKRIADYSSLVKKNTEPLSVMFNPKTGARSASLMSIISALMGAGVGATTGHLDAGLAIGALPTLIGYPAVKALTNEGLRNHIIKSMITARAKHAIQPKNIAPLVNALTQASQKPMEMDINKFAGYGTQ